MVVTAFAGPGTSSWQSTTYTASVEGAPVYVYAYQRNVVLPSPYWNANDPMEISWLQVECDESVDVEIARVSGSVTSYKIYPPEAVSGASIVAGKLRFTAQPNKNLLIEINGNRKDTICVFTTPPDSYDGVATQWSSLKKTVSSVSPGTDIFQTSSPHGFAEGQKVRLHSTGTLPSAVGGDIVSGDTATDYFVELLDDAPQEFRLTRTLGGASIDITGAGSGTITVYPAEWTDGATSLVFGPGVHNIGRLFKIADNTEVYIHGDAVVIGSFDLRGTDHSIVHGPGVHAGTFATSEQVQAIGSFNDRTLYYMYLGRNLSQWRYDNEVRGVVVVAAPGFLTLEGVFSWKNVKHISPWSYSTDGFETTPKSNTELYSEIIDCFAMCGDDAVKIEAGQPEGTHVMRRCFLISSNNSCIHLNYTRTFDDWSTSVIEDCHAMHTGVPDVDSPASGPGIWERGMQTIFKCWQDTSEANSAYARRNITIDGLKVHGPLAGRIFSIEVMVYPFPETTGYDGAGQIEDITVRDLWCEQRPGQVSRIRGRDANNRPRNIAFENLEIAGARITTDNVQGYIYKDGFAENVTLDNEPLDFDSSIRRTLLVIGDTTAAGTRPASELSLGGASAAAQSDFHIWNIQTKTWQPCTPGTNTSTVSAGSDRWGIETRFRQTLSALGYEPGHRLYCIKYALNSTLLPRTTGGLPHWSPEVTGSAFSALLQEIADAAAVAEDDRETVRIDGIVVSLFANEALQLNGSDVYASQIAETAKQLIQQTAQMDASPVQAGTFREDGPTPVVVVEPHFEWSGATAEQKAAAARRRAGLYRLAETDPSVSIYRTHNLLCVDGVQWTAASLGLASVETAHTLMGHQPSTEGYPEAFLHLLIGDSVMEGSAANSSLPTYLTGAQSGILFWEVDKGQFASLQAGTNNFVSSSDSTKHGPEMFCGNLLRAKHGTAWLIKASQIGALASPPTQPVTASTLPPMQLPRLLSFHPHVSGQLFDLHVRGSMVSAFDAMRRSGVKAKLGMVAVCLGTQDVSNSYGKPDSIASSVSSIRSEIEALCDRYGVDYSAARFVSALPAAALADAEGVAAEDVTKVREALQLLAKQDSSHKVVDLSSFSFADEQFLDAVSTAAFAQSLVEAYSSQDTSAVQPLFWPTMVELRKALRLSQVPADNDASAVIDAAVATVRTGTFQALGADRVAQLQATPSQASPTTTAGVLRKLAETTEAKWVRMELMRVLPMMFMDGASTVQSWQQEAAFREGSYLQIRDELRRLEDEVRSNLQTLASASLEGSTATARFSNILPDDTISPGDTVFEVF